MTEQQFIDVHNLTVLKALRNAASDFLPTDISHVHDTLKEAINGLLEVTDDRVKLIELES